MLLISNGRVLITWYCCMAYILYFVVNLQLTTGLETEGNSYNACGGNSTINAETGTLYSTNFPDNHNYLDDCVTNISLPSAFLIEISFDVFQTDSISNLNLRNEMCLLDFVEIVVNQRSMRICGNWIGKERLLYFIFFTSFISIRFRSDDQNSNQRFVLKWSSTSSPSGDLALPCAESLFETATTCYEIITKPDDWLSSHEICRRRGASLAKIEDLQTQIEIETRLYNSKMRFHAVWIGAHDRFFEGNYMWSDRSAVKFHNWFPGWRQFNENETYNARQPSDDGFSDEDCVEMRTLFSYPGKGTGHTTSFFWNDRNCNEKNPFICQHDRHRGKRSTDQVPLQCDHLLQLNDERPSVIVTSPGYPNNYPALASCHTIITATIGKQLRLDFLHFEIEDGKSCEYDNFTVSELPATERSHGFTQCGNWNRKLKLLRWTSAANRIVLTFMSDDTKHFTGVSVNVTLVDQGNLCDEGSPHATILYGPGGCWVPVNTSGNFTEADETCSSFGATIAEGTPENIHFMADVLKVSDTCRDVWLKPGNMSSLSNKISDVSSDSMCDAARICGGQRYEGNILLEYSSVVTQVSCSSLYYIFCQKRARTLKKRKVSQNVTRESGMIDLYNKDGKNYTNNQMTSFLFLANDGFRIVFNLVAYDIEYQDQCLYDYIETYGMTADSKYCGKNTESVIFVSKSNSAEIIFNTDEDITAAGFNLSWFMVKNDVAFQKVLQTESSSNLFSVNYPNAFPDKIDSCTRVAVPRGQRLTVEIININLPGNNCTDSKFEILAGTDFNKTFCGGTSVDTLTYFSRFILTNNGNMSFCMKAPRLKAGEGVQLQLSSVPGNSSRLTQTVTLLSNEKIQLSSVMFPDMFPDATTQEVLLKTKIGYIINVTLNVTTLQQNRCAFETLEINDVSLKNDRNNINQYSCRYLTNTAEYQTEITFTSVLNAVQIIFSSENLQSGSEAIKFSGYITSVKDPLYLNKTRKIEGTFYECDNSTCKNGGSCLLNADDRFSCRCLSQYTGLFCQASVCDRDVNKCSSRHATCQLTESGFFCDCEHGYWGDRCTMNSMLCQYSKCSGNGRCVLINNTETGCLCDESFTGSTCSESIPEPEEDLTIGQKLLKEPIWIGMIVILNLVFFFCVSYVIRRKCGKKIAKMLPHLTKATNSNSKENSKVEPSTASPEPTDKQSERNVYTLTIDTPKTRADSKRSTRKKALHEHHDSIVSAPSTPVVTEDNQEAALKLFAAYNTRKPDLSPNMTSIQTARNSLAIKTRDIMSCGILGGTVTLNPDLETENRTKEPSHGILRSYTISTEIHDFETRKAKARNEAVRKASSFAGSPVNSRNNDVDFFLDSPKSNAIHCFPEIKIINEHNCEEVKVSDSEENSDADILVTKDVSYSKSAENISGVKIVDHADSGYPSTTISTTQDGSQADEITLKIIPPASERRKLFTSKAKSSSFYKLGNEDNVKPIEIRKDARDSTGSDIPYKSSTSGDFLSFESEMCVPCKREQIERCAYSYDADLDKMHRCRGRRRCTAGYSGICNHHHRRHRRRRKCDCVKHHSYSKEIDIHQHLQREQYLPAGLHQLNEKWDVRRKHRVSRPLNSSTESDSCLCSAKEMMYHRRYHVKPAFSDNDFRRRHDSDPVSGFSCSSRLDFRSDDSCKTKLMRSFLSDTYRASFHDYSGSENSCEHHALSKRYLRSPHDSSVSNSRDKSRSPSPRRNNYLNLSLSVQKRRRSDTVVEVADDNVIKLDSNNSVSPGSPEFLKHPYNSPSSSTDYSVTNVQAKQYNDDRDRERLALRKVSDYQLRVRRDSSSEQMPDVEYVHKDNYEQVHITQPSGFSNLVKDNEVIPISVVSNLASVAQEDSAYQTKQPSIEKFKREASLKHSGVKVPLNMDTAESQDISARHEDKVHRHLHQAAMKLALLKRLQTRKTISKDSAIHTFSEDDLSADDCDNRGSFRPLVKRTSGSLAFQLRETSLSQVQEEHSGVSRDTDNYNTPTNETFGGSFDRPSTDTANSAIPMTDVSATFSENITSARLEETNV